MSCRQLSDTLAQEATRRYLESVGTHTPRFKASHYIAMLPIKDDALLCQLAQEAHDKGYSVRQLSARVKSLKSVNKGDDLGKALIKRIWDPRTLLQDVQMMRVCTDKECLLRNLSASERRRILGDIRSEKPRIGEWNKLLGELEKNLNDIEDDDWSDG